MKKILVALAMIGFAYSSAEAQERVSNQVCRFSNKGVSCYKTQYAENFKVCQDNYRYFICGETPTYANSTHPALPVLPLRTEDMTGYNTYAALHDNYTEPNAAPAMDMTAPQSQSYPANTGFGMSTATSYEGYYPKKNYIKVCYAGNNVAEENLNPYRGCPSPQSEGPAVNNSRNINANNAAYDLPPVTGRSEGE
jgi:hypothetical protein